MQAVITLLVFSGVILAIAFNLLDMVVVALLGVSLLTVFGIMSHETIINAVNAADGALALLFGGMVVARTLKPTGIFDHIGTRFLFLTRGSGKRFLLGIVILVVPLCAILPNATTVILLAPVIIRTAQVLEVDFVKPMILTAILSNSAGLLTIIGDPATFLIGSAVGLSFTGYLQRVSLGGLMAILVILPLMPLLMKEIWTTRRVLPETLTLKQIAQPTLCICSLGVLGVMICLFLFGDFLPTKIIPPAAAIMGATLALLVIYSLKVEPVEQVLRDVDWKTLLFLFCMFCLVEAVIKSGVLQSLSLGMNDWFGDNLLLAGFFLLACIGLLSGLLANIPVAAAMLFMTKSYLVVAEFVPEEALGMTFTDWPPTLLPVFVAMMFGATLGGNATLIGASANVVAAGICEANGRSLRFMDFLRCGAPIAACQLLLSALYVYLLSFMYGQ